jgi:hypothetical protein
LCGADEAAQARSLPSAVAGAIGVTAKAAITMAGIEAQMLSDFI